MDIGELLVFLYSCCLCLRFCHGQVEKEKMWDTDKYKEEAGQTFNLVFHKYNPKVRPPQAFIEINVNITLRHIRQLSVRKQELQTVFDMEMNWIDSRLNWYPDRVVQIMANTSSVWTPDVVFTNSVSETKLFYPSNVRITHKGHVSWTQKLLLTTFCRTRLDEETQNCGIQLGFMSNSYNDQTDRFFSNSSSFNLPADYVNHEWHLIDAELDLDVGNLTRRASTMEINLWMQQQPIANGEEVVVTGDVDGDNYPSYGTTSNNCGSMEEFKKNDGNGASRVSGLAGTTTLMTYFVLVCLSSLALPGLCFSR